MLGPVWWFNVKGLWLTQTRALYVKQVLPWQHDHVCAFSLSPTLIICHIKHSGSALALISLPLLLLTGMAISHRLANQCASAYIRTYLRIIRIILYWPQLHGHPYSKPLFILLANFTRFIRFTTFTAKVHLFTHVRAFHHHWKSLLYLKICFRSCCCKAQMVSTNFSRSHKLLFWSFSRHLLSVLSMGAWKVCSCLTLAFPFLRRSVSALRAWESASTAASVSASGAASATLERHKDWRTIPTVTTHPLRGDNRQQWQPAKAGKSKHKAVLIHDGKFQWESSIWEAYKI